MAIRGLYFAWLTKEGEAWNAVAHRRKDLPLMAVAGGKEAEGSDTVPVTLVTESMNPEGLVGKRWAILSFETPDGTLHPMYRMRRRPTSSTASESLVRMRRPASLTASMPLSTDVRRTDAPGFIESPAVQRDLDLHVGKDGLPRAAHQATLILALGSTEESARPPDTELLPPLSTLQTAFGLTGHERVRDGDH